MAADVLAPYISTLATVVLTMQDNEVCLFHGEGFQLPARGPIQYKDVVLPG